MAPKGPGSVLERVGIIGDVHCEDEVLSRLLGHFARESLDAVLCVGDLADGYGDINRTCQLLEEHQVLCVTGNHDRWLLTGELREESAATRLQMLTPATKRYIEQLPATMALETRAGKLLLCHGTADDDLLAVKRDHLRYDLENNAPLQRLIKQNKFQFLVGGHTHQIMVRKVGPLILINAGTLHRGYAQNAAVIDFGTREVEFFDLAGKEVLPLETTPFPEQDELSSRVLRL